MPTLISAVPTASGRSGTITQSPLASAMALPTRLPLAKTSISTWGGADPATVDPRFLLDPAKADRIEKTIATHWPEQIDPADLGNESLAATVRSARLALLSTLDLEELG